MGVKEGKNDGGDGALVGWWVGARGLVPVGWSWPVESRPSADGIG